MEKDFKILIIVLASGLFLVRRFILQKRLKKELTARLDQSAQVLDVREPEEYRNGCFPGSLNIPLSQLEIQIGKLIKDKPIIVVCASGVRSKVARELLQKKGFSAVVNGGSWRNLIRS